MTQLIDLGKLRFYFAGEFNAATTYEVNDVVKYGGNIYVYINVISDKGHAPTDPAFWALMIKGINFEGIYDPAIAYQVGDAVAYGGTVYLALADSLGTTPGTNPATWTRYLEGIQYEGTYAAATRYQKNDIVLYGANVYIAKGDTLANVPTNTTYWDQMLSGISAQGAWSAGMTYRINQVVAYGGRLYQATGDSTPGTPPANATGSVNTNWQLFVDAITFRGVWTSTLQYYVNDVVTRGGTTWVALRTHVSGANDSATDAPGNGSGTWRKFNSGVRWMGTLTVGNAYVIDDLVTDGVSTYITTYPFTAITGGPAAQVDGGGNPVLQLLAKGADNLPAQGGNAGKFLQTNGTSASWANATVSYKVITAAYSAVASDALLCDSTGGSFTVTLPATPVLSHTVKLVDLAGTFDGRPVTVLRNGLRINGVADDLVLNVKNSSVDLVYTGATYGWKVL